VTPVRPARDGFNAAVGGEAESPDLPHQAGQLQARQLQAQRRHPPKQHRSRARPCNRWQTSVLSSKKAEALGFIRIVRIWLSGPAKVV
jgi:hypothetical protein